MGRRGMIRSVGAGTVAAIGGLIGSAGNVEGAWGGDVSIRGFDVSDENVRPESGEGTTLRIKLKNTYDEEKVVFVVPHLFSESGSGYYERMFLEPGVYGGNSAILGSNETTWENFEWAPPVDLDPGVYGIDLVVNDNNRVDFWGNYDSWTIHDSIAAGYDVDPSCYGSIEQYQQEIRSSGGPSAPGVLGAMSLISLVYSQKEVAENCSN